MNEPKDIDILKYNTAKLYHFLGESVPKNLSHMSMSEVVKLTTMLTDRFEMRSYITSQHANVDPLTCLGNRQKLEEIVKKYTENRRSTDERRDFSVVMLDIDKMKSVNDNYGHAMGDKLIATLGFAIKNTIRDNDAAVRFGGDEFITFLNGCDLNDARYVTERIRSLFIGNWQVANPEFSEKMSVSYGIAYSEEASHKDKSVQELMKVADSRMYAMKNANKRQDIIAREADVSI